MSASASVSPEWAQPAESTPIDYGALRALVVEDSTSMRNARRLTLSNFGVT